MAQARTPLAGALASEFSEERLAELREQLVAEISVLQDELRFVEAALGRRPRRRATSTGQARKRHSSTGGRFPGVRRTDVLDVVREHGQPVRPADVPALFASRGIETNMEAMRTALNRLVGDGLLVKLGDGSFAVSDDESRSGNGGVPVTDPTLPSQDDLLQQAS